MRLVAKAAQRIDYIGRCFTVLPANGDAARCEIDANISDALELAERLFNGLDAEAAMNARNREVKLAQAIAQRTARNQHFIWRDSLNGSGYLSIFNAATHKILPSFTRTRMMWR
ncbi:hypothetical protein FQZ97_957730 [compost metagenome]